MIASILVRVLTRLLAWTLYRSLRRHVPRPDLKALIDREPAEVSTSIRCFADNQTSEVGILTQRLGRRFDPGMALNEAANRALEQKAAYGEANLHAVTGEPAELTPTQLKALEFQKQYLKRVLRSAPATGARGAVVEERMFPIMGYHDVPWRAIASAEKQANENHGQTLERLADRGGLSPCEACAVMQFRPWKKMDDGMAREVLDKLVANELERLALIGAKQP